MVCELYGAGRLGAVWWDEAQIGLFMGLVRIFLFFSFLFLLFGFLRFCLFVCLFLFCFVGFVFRSSAFVSEENYMNTQQIMLVPDRKQ